MTLFGKKPKAQRLEDKIWFSSHFKRHSILTESEKLVNEGEYVFLVTFFSDAQEQLILQLKRENKKFKLIENATYSNLKDDETGRIFVLKAEIFDHSIVMNSVLNSLDEDPINFIFFEHYPTFSKEEKVLKQIEELTKTSCKICFYASLDESILHYFGGDNIIDMVKRLGMSEHECISHSLITKSILNAQKKIEKSISQDFSAYSQEEWFRINLKKLD